jgi:tetratricopeptide (TPR) repeat protein
LLGLSFDLGGVGRLAAVDRVIQLALNLSEAADYSHGVTSSLVNQMWNAVRLGKLQEAQGLYEAIWQRPALPRNLSRPGEIELAYSELLFIRKQLTGAILEEGYQLAVQQRSLVEQKEFLALRAEWELSEFRPAKALDAIEQALHITRKCGIPAPGYLALRALALARLGQVEESRESLAEGQESWSGVERRFPLHAAESYLALGDREQARAFAVQAYRLAWADGPPYAYWYELNKCRELLAELGEPEPQLPPFDPAKVEPIPHEAEIRAAIDKLKARRARQRDDEGGNPT